MIKIDTGEVEQKCARLFCLKQVIGTNDANPKKNEEGFVREILYEIIENIKFYLNFKSQKPSKNDFSIFFLIFFRKNQSKSTVLAHMLVLKYTKSCQIPLYHFLIQFDQFLQNLASSVMQKIRAKKRQKEILIYIYIISYIYI